MRGKVAPASALGPIALTVDTPLEPLEPLESLELLDLLELPEPLGPLELLVLLEMLDPLELLEPLGPLVPLELLELLEPLEPLGLTATRGWVAAGGLIRIDPSAIVWSGSFHCDNLPTKTQPSDGARRSGSR